MTAPSPYIDALIARCPSGSARVYGDCLQRNAPNNMAAGMNGNRADDMPAGIGHNSNGARPTEDGDSKEAWLTPSKLSLEEAAKACIGNGRYAQERRALLEAISDPRLGICPLPVLLYGAVIEHINGGTGLAFPGSSRLAQEIVNYLNNLPSQYRLPALDNATTLVRQCGYAVTEKRAPPRGGRAVTHYAITYPTPEEKRAAIDAYLLWQQKQRAKRATRTKHRPDLIPAMRSADPTTGVRSEANLTGAMRSDGADLIASRGSDLIASMKKQVPLSITEPERRNPKTMGLGKRSPQEGDKASIEEALSAYNEAAAMHGFSPCSAPTDARRKRLAKRLQDIGGVDAFKLALSALPSDDFLMGRVRPKSGQTPFKLDIDKLMQTDGGMGDVLARLIDAAGDAARHRQERAADRKAADEMTAAYERMLAEEEAERCRR